jgi:hypothetical protein
MPRFKAINRNDSRRTARISCETGIELDEKITNRNFGIAKYAIDVEWRQLVALSSRDGCG